MTYYNNINNGKELQTELEILEPDNNTNHKNNKFSRHSYRKNNHEIGMVTLNTAYRDDNDENVDGNITDNNTLGSVMGGSCHPLEPRQSLLDKKNTQIGSQTFKQKAMKHFSSTPMVVLSILLVFYALYAEDIRIIHATKKQDHIFLITHIICVAYFAFEFILLCVIQTDYYKSMYVFLDLASLASLIVDVMLFGAVRGIQNPQIRAARAARVATRVGRLIRALRLMVSVGRTCKRGKKNQDKFDHDEGFGTNKDDHESAVEDKSRFGKYLTTLLTKKVIMGCLLMVFVLPLLQNGMETDLIDTIDTYTEDLQRCLDIHSSYCTTLESRIAETKFYVYRMAPKAHDWYNDIELYKRNISMCNDLPYKLISIDIIGNDELRNAIFSSTTGLKDDIQYNKLRLAEKYIKQYPSDENITSNSIVLLAEFDFSETHKQAALFNIFQTTFLIMVLIVGAWSLNNDTITHVVIPVQKMLESVQRLAHDPFYFWDNNNHAGENNTAGVLSGDVCDGEGSSSDDDSKEAVWDPNSLPPEHEIHMLHTTVMKISRLLALGFGRAGWNIIRSVVLQGRNIDMLMGGTKVQGIFMFSDIRNFTDVTECLDKNVMVFVNKIAAIVHGTTQEFSGATNKNIGDAFLSVWTFPDKITVNSRLETTCPLDELQSPTPVEISDLVDRAFLCTIKIHFGISNSKELKKYQHHPAIASRMKNYRVRLGVGLHVGWAIEGAIGSSHKIDATYLSPHVNISARLESGTKLYKVPVLFSCDFVKLLSDTAFKFVRQVDRIEIKGSYNIFSLYTIDLPSRQEYEEINRKLLRNYENGCDGNHTVQTSWRREYSSCKSIFFTDIDLKIVREYHKKLSDFFIAYREAFDNYISGNWQRASKFFSKALLLKEKDGPCTTILSYIERLECKPPDNWDTHGRELKEF